MCFHVCSGEDGEDGSIQVLVDVKKVSANGEVVGLNPLGFYGYVPSQNIIEPLSRAVVPLVTASG